MQINQISFLLKIYIIINIYNLYTTYVYIELYLPCKFDTFEESSTVPPFEDVDHGSEHEDPATEALEEHGESIPPPKILVLPL